MKFRALSLAFCLSVLFLSFLNAQRIGDVLCTDSTTEHIMDFASSGKTACGVVFYVDYAQGRGWAVELTEPAVPCSWSLVTADVPGLVNASFVGAVTQTDGFHNTQMIRAAGSAAQYPAAYSVDFAHGWYLPAAGQLRQLLTNLSIVSASLTMLSSYGVPTSNFVGEKYWSSNEGGSGYAVPIYDFGLVGFTSKSDTNNVRAVRTFTFAPRNPQYRIGDVFHNADDNTDGIVCYVDSTGTHGWMVAMQDLGTYAWATEGQTVTSLPRTHYTSYGSWSGYCNVFDDTTGYSNTLAIRLDGTSSTLPAAYAVDVAHGWYLPAVGQMTRLYDALPVVNASLTINGGTSLSTSEDYWCGSWSFGSSTVYAWYSDQHTGTINGATSPTLKLVRAFRNFTAEPSQQHTVTASSDCPTCGSVYGSGVYDENTVVTLTAVPDTCYRFVQWSNGETANPYSLTLTSDTMLTALFSTSNFYINAYPNDPVLGEVLGSDSFPCGATAVLKASPTHCSRFVGWSDGCTQNPYLLHVASDSSVMAIFVPDSILVTVLPEDSTMGTVSGSGYYHCIDTAVLCAVPAHCYRFVQWSDGSVENPRAFVPTFGQTFVAHFEIIPYQLSVSANNAAYGHVTGTGTYDCEDTAVMAASPYSSYHFVSWDDGEVANPRRVAMVRDTSFVAVFASNIGVSAYETNSPIRVFPNPTSDVFYVQGDDIQQVDVYDLTGHIVCVVRVANPDGQFVVDLSAFAAGIYPIRISSENGMVRHKIIKMK